jgi:hypothetical protein
MMIIFLFLGGDWKMEKNMGTIDRVIRASIAVLIAILYFTGKISGTVAVILGIVAVLSYLRVLSDGVQSTNHLAFLPAKDLNHNITD